MAGSIRRRACAATALLAVLITAGCAAPRSEGGGAAGALAATTPEAFGTETSGTVIERDGRTDLCFGVLDLYPPACGGGVELAGWEWDDVEAEYDEPTDVHWGDFTVAGTYDPDAQILTVESVAPLPEPRPVPATDMLYPSRCPEPDGGWRVVDEALATYESQMATFSVIPTLEGYGTSWVDRSLVPPVEPGTDPLEELRLHAVHAGLEIINVGVRGDPAVAEARLREVWGGALCVFEADVTADEMDTRLEEIMQDHQFLSDHQILSAWPDVLAGVIRISLVHDAGGEVQRRMTEEYGPGAVVISSILSPL